MATELTTCNVVKLYARKAPGSRIYQNRPCASCGRPIGRNRNYVRSNDCGTIVMLHRRCLLAEMRACCALA